MNDRYRLTRGDEVNAWHPAQPDRRPRLIVPLDRTDAREDVAPIGSFFMPFELSRLTAMNHGREAWSAWNDPTLCLPPATALTCVFMQAQRATPRIIMMTIRFECLDDDMARLRDKADDDYVSVLINLDRTHERVVEVGVSAAGQMFSRHYQQYVGAHACEPQLHGGATTVLAEATSADATAWEEAQASAGRAPAARVTFGDDRWIAEMRVPLNTMAGGYIDEGMVYPCNMVRRHPVLRHGAPAGINWQAADPGYTWSPVRFMVEEFESAGFLAVGDLDDESFERQVAQIDAASQRARIERRINHVSNRKAVHDAWRRRIDPKTLDTQWLPRALPGYEHVQRGFALNNSRQLITLNDGRTLVVAEDAQRLSVVICPEKLDPVGNDLSGDVTVITEEPGVTHASAARDDDGVVHLVYATDAGVFTASASDGWKPRTLRSGGALPYDIDCIDGSMVVLLADHALHLYTMRLGDTAPVMLPFEGRCPVLTPATGGGTHVAFEFNATLYYIKLDGALKPIGEPVIAAYAECLFPAIVEADGRPLIVFQYLGLQKVDARPELYIAERERCGAGIGYAHATDTGRFRRGHVMTYDEIVVRKLNSRQYMLDMVNRPHRGRAFATMDENWRPTISLDGDGIVRAAWVNTTREHAFTAQWTGSAFTQPQVLAGPLSAPTPHFGLDKHPPRGAQVKHLVVAEQRLLLDGWFSHAIQLDRSDEVYFLDESVIARRSGVQWKVNTPRRHIDNPILELPGSGRGGGRDGLSRPTVIPGENGTWLLVSAKSRKEEGCAYALSDDGYAWTLVDLPAFLDVLPKHLHGAVTQTAADEYLAPGYTFTDAFKGLEDLLEPDPAKRFKKLAVEGKATDAGAVRRVWYSPDGVNWTKGPAATNNVHMNETHVPNIYDPWDKPERRFKLYGRTTTEQGRTLAMLWSADMVTWHGDHAITVREDPYSRPAAQPASPSREAFVTLEGSSSATESEHYYCMPWLEAGHTMMLYANLHADGHKSARIAFSRDGFHFSRLGDVDYLVNGAPGEIDAGSIDHPQLLTVGDEVRFYYGCSGEKHGTLPFTGQHAIGVSTTQRKRWSYYETCDEIGTLQTVVIDADALRGRGLTLNKTGDVRVTIIDAATDKAVSDASDSVEDGHDSAVTWTGKPLACGRAAAVRLRFELRGRGCRLYNFALPTLR